MSEGFEPHATPSRRPSSLMMGGAGGGVYADPSSTMMSPFERRGQQEVNRSIDNSDWPVKYAVSRSHSNASEDGAAAIVGGKQNLHASPSSYRAGGAPPPGAAGPSSAIPSFYGNQMPPVNNTTVLTDPSLTSPEQLLQMQQQHQLLMQQQMLQMQQQMSSVMSPNGNGVGVPQFSSPMNINVSAVPNDNDQHINHTNFNGFMSPNQHGHPYHGGDTGARPNGSHGTGATPRRAMHPVGDGVASPSTSVGGSQRQQQFAPSSNGGGGVAANHHRLMTLDPRRFTVDDINELLKVIEVSNQYGKEIERSVEELATLLQKKTIECEGLRKLAAENHSALADAVKNEYNSRVRVETKQSNEIRELQNKIATMRSEKDDLQREVETLRMMVEQLKATPASLTARENHEGTLFNRLAKGIDKRQSAEDQMLTTWNMPRPSQLTQSQRELVNFVGNISADVARSLQSAGSFDFLIVLCQRLCTPSNAKGDIYPEIGPTIGELLRELRLDVVNGTAGSSQAVPVDSNGRPIISSDAFLASVNGTGQRLSIAQQAATATIPLVKKSARMRVIDLFLANNPQDYTQPNKVTELNKLLEEHEGKEEALYERLLADYRRKDPSGAFLNRLPPNNYVYQPPQTPQNAVIASPTAPFRPAAFNGGDEIGTAAESELHVRVTLMYKKYNPSKLHTKEYKELVAKYPPETLLRALIQRYGPEPTAEERRRLVRLISENTEIIASGRLMYRSNLHPAVAGASPQGGMGFGGVDPSPIAAKSLFGSASLGVGGGAAPSPLSPAYDAHLSMNEALARTRARELMQSYARDKQRTNDLEQQVGRITADNDELAVVASQLQRQVKDLQEQQFTREEAFTKERGEFEATFATIQNEMERVTQLSAHQVSDLMAQLRLREEEISHIQGELNKSIDENGKLRREIARQVVGGEGGGESSDLQKAQARSVELARRLLDSERAKRASEDALIDDRKHHHLALNTIEQLRQQLAASEGRVDSERRKREDEVLQLRRQLDQVREDYDQREDAYKRVLMNGNTGEDANASTSSAAGERSNGAKSGQNATSGNLAILCSTLEARTQSQQEHIDFLTEQNEKATAQLQHAIKELQLEKARRVEEVTKAQEVIRGLKDDGTRRELVTARKDKERVIASLADLKNLYEESVDHFAASVVGPSSSPSAHVNMVVRTLADIHATLRQILTASQTALHEGTDSPNEQTQRMLEMIMKQMSGGVGRADDEVITNADKLTPSSSTTGKGNTNRSSSGVQSLASHEHTRQVEALRHALEESERSKEVALAERDEREAQREREVRAQIEQLVSHTQRLQRQAALDEEELENCRYQLQSAESNASVRLARTRRDCARSIEGLHAVLKQIEAEHHALLQRRYNAANSLAGMSSVGQATSEDASPLAAAARQEARLGDRIHEALQQQESLLREWQGDDASMPPANANVNSSLNYGGVGGGIDSSMASLTTQRGGAPYEQLRGQRAYSRPVSDTAFDNYE